VEHVVSVFVEDTEPRGFFAGMTAGAEVVNIAPSQFFYGIPPSRILVFARTRRCPMVVGDTRKAWAMRAASSPRTVCIMSGVCIAGAMAG
jgi:hypothetical protein